MQKMPTLFRAERFKLISAIILLVLFQALAMAGTALSTRQIFSSLHGTERLPMQALLGLAVSVLLFSVFKVFSRRLSESLGQSYAIDFRKNFYTHLSRQPASTLAERRDGALSIRFVGDLSAMRNWVSQGVAGVVSAVIILPIAIITLWHLHPHYAWVLLLPISISLVSMFVIGLKLKSVHKVLRSERANIAIDMMERVPAAPQMRLLGRTKADVKLLKKRGEKLLSVSAKRAFYLESTKSLPDIGTGLAGVLLLWLTASTGATAAGAAAGLSVLGLLAMPLRELATAWDLYCSWEIARDKSEQVFEKTTLDRAKKGTKVKLAPVDVTVKNVTIVSNEYQQLACLNFSVPASQSMALLVSSEHRQHLLNVLATLDDPYEGSICLADVPITDIALNRLPRLVHFLTLDAPVLQGSFRRVLTLGANKRPKDNLVKLIKEYGLSDTTARLGGLSARIWEDGRNLNDDEKFRAFMVRAILNKPQYLLINDPQDLVNEKTQRLLQKLIADIRATTILVTQNDAMLVQCDDSLDLHRFSTTLKHDFSHEVS